MSKDYDFCGWATRNDILCSDGRTIRKNAFKHNDGTTVPLVWNHQHNDPTYVIGHALLENRDEGVYAYGYLNDTQSGQDAKEMIRHGDITALSIYANKLQQNGGDVVHGDIREVSLVLAGANLGAYIEQVIQHGERLNDEAIIYSGVDFNDEDIEHAEEPKKEKESEKEDNKTIKDILDTLNEEQRNVVNYLVGQILSEEKEDEKNEKEDDEEMKHSDEKTIKEIYDEMTDEQKDVVNFLVGAAVEDAKGGSGEDDEEDEEEMKHNVFENDTRDNTLSHAETAQIFEDAKRLGSLKESILQHADEWGMTYGDPNEAGERSYSPEYGMANIDSLFPDAKMVDPAIQYIRRKNDWVADVMAHVHRSPVSRIKSIYADLTQDEARAKGYIKGNLKKEEVFGLLKRTTSPTTVYKKQKLDRDDVTDITDFDVVAELKGEMRAMLDEELARAFLIGDGRSTASADKIDETHIRPIWTDSDLFTIKHTVDLSAFSSPTVTNKADALVDAAVIAMDEYEGSGSPVFYASQYWITQMLLLKDANGRRIYKDLNELAAAMSVSRIVAVTPMKNQSRTTSAGTFALAGIIVNLDDYKVGADKGGAVNMFDDFDIDYNQMKYLIETRCSGSMTKPHAAIALEFKTA